MPRTMIESSALTVAAEDIHAVRKGETPRNTYDYSIFSGVRPGGATTVQVFTRLRQSGKQDPLVDVQLTGEAALDLWEHVGALARTDASGFVLCGRWYLRPSRVRLIKRAEYASHPDGGNSTYDVYLSMVDADRDDGWVARLTLDLESGRELTKHLRARRATEAVC